MSNSRELLAGHLGIHSLYPSAPPGEKKVDEQGHQHQSLMQTEAPYKVPYSRSFTEKTTSGHSRPGSTLDTRHVHVYLRRQGSRSSVFSTTSAGLHGGTQHFGGGDNLSLVSSSSAPPHHHGQPSSSSTSASRPVSAEGNLPPSGAAHHKPFVGNTRIVVPNPTRLQVAGQGTGRGLLTADSPASTLTRSASIPTLRRRPSYLDHLVCQVLDYLFMGGIEAGYNANLLCRLNIEYLIDISNVEPLKVPRSKRSDVPCLCSLETAHSRARMTLMIEETSQLDLTTYFEDVNRFIESARACGKCVLVHSYQGRNRCAVLIVQYLMKSKNLGLERAVELLRAVKGEELAIGENFMRSLRKWESILRGGGGVDPAVMDKFSVGATSTTAASGGGGSTMVTGNGIVEGGKKAAWM